jgi:hypothetical protein
MSTGTMVQMADYGAVMLDNQDAPPGEEVSGPVFPNGLVYADPNGGAWIRTGIYMGPVRLSWSTGEPAQPNLNDWEDVVQVVVTPSAGILIARGFMMSGPDGNSPNLALDPEAEHMLRCSARGRDTAPEDAMGEEDEPFEEYHLELWLRRPGDEPAVLKLTSEFGKDLAATEPS